MRMFNGDHSVESTNYQNAPHHSVLYVPATSLNYPKCSPQCVVPDYNVVPQPPDYNGEGWGGGGAPDITVLVSIREYDFKITKLFREETGVVWGGVTKSPKLQAISVLVPKVKDDNDANRINPASYVVLHTSNNHQKK